jgi:hypothetical protein
MLNFHHSIIAKRQDMGGEQILAQFPNLLHVFRAFAPLWESVPLATVDMAASA